MSTQTILEIALPTPLYQTFDYLPPEGVDCTALKPGIRLSVPFGPRETIGVLLATKASPERNDIELKAATAVLDQSPIISAELMSLLDWAAGYYFYPRGDALFHALPPALRKGKALDQFQPKAWQLSHLGLGLGPDAFKRSHRQREAWQWLMDNGPLAKSAQAETPVSRSALKALQDKGWVEEVVHTGGATIQEAPGPELNEEQRAATEAICTGLGAFHPCLLDGITGSGKTEVYLRAIAAVLARGEQALVLVPEIGLTPQTLDRFRQRFGSAVVTIHSGLGDGERTRAWAAAKDGSARVVVGTRSAIFTPFTQLGLIVVDEEHDQSYKQQDGFRYSARDLAVKRAQTLAIPVVLGSATPSIESRHNAEQGRYQTLHLSERAGNAKPPRYTLQDLRGQSLEEGCAPDLLLAVDQTLTAGNQALLFLNRRGFSPSLICHQCGWVADCPRCDAHMVVHLRRRQLRCHHCEAESSLPDTCPQCSSRQLLGEGLGTERSEAFLQARFPDVPVIRIDRDTTQRKDAMSELLAPVQAGEPCILIGTQMLAKGHHFPDVTLVGVLDADAGLFSSDFRGPERTAQMLMQVAGRAGRADKAGTVIIQTHNPEHPVLNALCNDRYPELSAQLLAERQTLGLPPFGYLALVRCDDSRPGTAENILDTLRKTCQQPDPNAAWVGPLPAPRRVNRHRAHLLIRHQSRGGLHRLLASCQQFLQDYKPARRVRWSIDVDPQDVI